MGNIKKTFIYILIGILVVFVLFGMKILFDFVMDRTGFGWKSEYQLQIPEVLEDQNSDPGITEYEINVQEGQTEFITGKFADTFGYNGSYLGPILRFTRGQQVNVTVNNQLQVSTTLHWHGLLVDGEDDGGPMQGILAGESWSPSFMVEQPAATLWYHPHFMGTTADQVYFGLAGLIYIDDENSDKLDLPLDYGIDDIPLIVQDRNFQSDGNFDYRTTMMGLDPGDEVIINGTIKPFVSISNEKIRLRILNGSNSENFNFSLSDGIGFQQIASDGGFLEKPVSMKNLRLAPGERAEIIVDFKNVDKNSIFLLNNRKKILEFKIAEYLEKSPGITESLTSIDEIPLGNNPVTRVFELESMGINGTINGRTFDMDRIDEEVNINETEVWIIRNIGGMMQTGGHPFHIHGTQFQIISRDGVNPPLNERGYKDTVFVADGEEVVVRVRFNHLGVFMYHCHILEHEDSGMMGQFRVNYPDAR